MAQTSQKILVAVPGKSFGPIRIGERVPDGWDIRCKPFGEEPIEQYYFFRLGLSTDVRTRPSPIVIQAAFVPEPFVLRQVLPTATPCWDPTGQVFDPLLRKIAPKDPGTVYVSSTGVMLGDFRSEVVRKTGRLPDREGAFGGEQEMVYNEGIEYLLTGDDRVFEIIVLR